MESLEVLLGGMHTTFLVYVLTRDWLTGIFLLFAGIVIFVLCGGNLYALGKTAEEVLG